MLVCLRRVLPVEQFVGAVADNSIIHVQWLASKQRWRGSWLLKMHSLSCLEVTDGAAAVLLTTRRETCICRVCAC